MTTRALDSAQLAGIAGKRVPALFFVRLDFPLTPVYVHNGIGTIDVGGHSYIGIYDYALLDTLEETLENRPSDIRMGIKRVAISTVDSVITQKYHGKPAFVYYSVADVAGKPIATPVEMWRGTIDVVTFDLTTAGISYIVTCKNIMSNWARTKIRRITDAEQQKRFPGDTAYRHLASNEDKTVMWGPDPNKPIAERTAPGPHSRNTYKG